MSDLEIVAEAGEGAGKREESNIPPPPPLLKA